MGNVVLMNIGIVVGTRPHVGKIYSLQKAVRELAGNCCLLHTNQHYDYEMQQLLFDELGYAPDEILQKYSIGNAIDWVMEMINRYQLDFIFLQGDSAPALVGSVAAIYSGIGIGHMESGLRANDTLMIEERNRVMVDSASHYLFCYCEEHAENLRKSKNFRGKIFVVGNPTVDLIDEIRPRLHILDSAPYIYVTIHRRELTEDYLMLCEVLKGIAQASRQLSLDIIFPIHPRTRQAFANFGIDPRTYLGSKAELLPPVSMIDSLSYVANARIVVTDSGCIQEEACILNTPCVTVRKNTERPETLRVGANILSECSKMNIVDSVLRANEIPVNWNHPYGNGSAARDAVEIVMTSYNSIRNY